MAPQSVRKAPPCQRRNVPGGAHPQPSPACSSPSAFKAAAKRLSALLPAAAKPLSERPPNGFPRCRCAPPNGFPRCRCAPPNGFPRCLRHAWRHAQRHAQRHTQRHTTSPIPKGIAADLRHNQRHNQRHKKRHKSRHTLIERIIIIKSSLRACPMRAHAHTRTRGYAPRTAPRRGFAAPLLPAATYFPLDLPGPFRTRSAPG